MLPKITIITPSYNQAHFLEQTIDSVLSQNYPSLEYFIMDGGSQDGSVEIIKKYEKYVTHWESVKDKGQSDAIQKGIHRATGSVINWLNSDDFYEKGTLHLVGEHFQDSNLKVLCGRSRIFGNGQPDRYSSGTDIYPSNLAKTIGWARIDQPETFFRTEAWISLGGLNPQFHYQMDKELWVRYLFAIELENIKQISDCLVNFRLHGQSKTVSQEKKFAEEERALFQSIAKQISFPWPEVLQVNLDHNFSSDFLHTKPEMAKHALEYYLLAKADEAYYIGNDRTVKILLDAISEVSFGEDSKLKNSLEKKMKIPSPFRSLLRKMKRRLSIVGI